MNTNGTTTKTTRPSREKASIYIYKEKKKEPHPRRSITLQARTSGRINGNPAVVLCTRTKEGELTINASACKHFCADFAKSTFETKSRVGVGKTIKKRTAPKSIYIYIMTRKKGTKGDKHAAERRHGRQFQNRKRRA